LKLPLLKPQAIDFMDRDVKGAKQEKNLKLNVQALETADAVDKDKFLTLTQSVPTIETAEAAETSINVSLVSLPESILRKGRKLSQTSDTPTQIFNAFFDADEDIRNADGVKDEGLRNERDDTDDFVSVRDFESEDGDNVIDGDNITDGEYLEGEGESVKEDDWLVI
jgi:hypothetical protein